jgi:hypothetical protein
VHAEKGPPSRAHSNVAFGAESVNVKLADVIFVEPDGPLVIVGVGVVGAASTVLIITTDAATTTRAATTATMTVVLLGALVGRFVSMLGAPKRCAAAGARG